MEALVLLPLTLPLALGSAAQDPALAEDAGSGWEVSGTVIYSDPPGSEDRLTPILYADKDELHLELRYNYEDLETLALFAGWRIETGEAVTADIVPMLGGVVGDTDGIAPGLELDVAWQRLAWYAEAEYLFDLDDRDDDFFYAWSTLTYGLTDWLDAGLVTERSKLVDTDYSVQRGLALEVTRGILGFSLYAYNIGDGDDFYAAVALELAP
jgi:hypothetical protein